MPLNYSPRNPQEMQQERMSLCFDHVALSATTTQKLWLAPAGRGFAVDRVLYINDTGLTGDATNAFKLELKNGATLITEVFNTDTNDVPAGATLAAATFIERDTDAEVPSRALNQGDTLSAVFTLDGVQTLPAGRLIVEGRLL